MALKCPSDGTALHHDSKYCRPRELWCSTCLDPWRKGRNGRLKRAVPKMPNPDDFYPEPL